MANDRDEVEQVARTVKQTGHNHFITTVVPAMLRELAAENAALREKLEAAEAERDEALAGQAAACICGRQRDEG